MGGAGDWHPDFPGLAVKTGGRPRRRRGVTGRQTPVIPARADRRRCPPRAASLHRRPPSPDRQRTGCPLAPLTARRQRRRRLGGPQGNISRKKSCAGECAPCPGRFQCQRAVQGIDVGNDGALVPENPSDANGKSAPTGGALPALRRKAPFHRRLGHLGQMGQPKNGRGD